MFDTSGTAWEECKSDASPRSQPNPCHQDGEGDGGNCTPGEDQVGGKVEKVEVKLKQRASASPGGNKLAALTVVLRHHTVQERRAPDFGASTVICHSNLPACHPQLLYQMLPTFAKAS